MQCQPGSQMLETAFRIKSGNTPRHMTWQKAIKIMMKKMGSYPGMERYLYWMMINCRWRYVVHLHHDTRLAGHPGQEKMLELLERSYFWSGMTTYVKNYIFQCDQCACFKGSNVAPPGKLQPLNIPNMPWVDISTVEWQP